MLVFSTKIPLKAESTRSQWVALFKEWVVNAKRYKIYEADFNGFDCAGHAPIEIDKGDQKFAITFYKDDTITLAACRLECRSHDEVWVTQNVAYEEAGRKFLVVQTHCIKKEYIGQLPKPAPPFTIKLFIRNGLCDMDGSFPITDRPVPMSDQYIEPCTQVMQGQGDGIMPVVYVSSYYWPTEMDVRSLARDLQGIAHVVEETDYEMSKKLRDASNGQNVYGGYVGVYFPGHSYRRKFADQFYTEGTAKDKMAEEIIYTIRNALLNKADATRYSWEHIKTLQHKQKVGKLQVDTASLEELRAWYNEFMDENTRLSDELTEVKSANTKLFEENQRLSAILEGYQSTEGTEKVALLQLGKEHDLYPGEHNDTLIDILTSSLNTLGEGTRPYHIVQSILKANKKNGTGAKIEQAVKKIFKGDGDILNADTMRTLQHMGFSVEKGKKHIELVFGNDNRYQFTTAATPGDHRGGNNMISIICRKLFVKSK